MVFKKISIGGICYGDNSNNNNNENKDNHCLMDCIPASNVDF